MNKGNKTLLGILAFIVVCVVGYALFSESITVTGTASASGDFAFEKTCTLGDSRNIYSNIIRESGYGTESCVVKDNSITISTELLYPSATRLYTIEMKNVGSIDGMVEVDEELMPIIPNTLKRNEYVLELYNKSDDALYQSYNLLEESDEITYDYIRMILGYFILLTSEGNLLLTDELLLESERVYQNADGSYFLKIKPGDTLIWHVSSMWNVDAEQTNYYSKFKFNADIKIDQFVEDGLTPATDIETCYEGC